MVNRIRDVVMIILVLIFAFFLIYFSGPKKCGTEECFQGNLAECKAARYVNEEKEASWGYEILGLQGRDCEIRVTLLMAKEGELGIEKFEGNSMSCFYASGVVVQPEKDLDKCSGKLKEDLQEILIERLHRYVIDNLGEIQEELKRV